MPDPGKIVCPRCGTVVDAATLKPDPKFLGIKAAEGFAWSVLVLFIGGVASYLSDPNQLARVLNNSDHIPPWSVPIVGAGLEEVFRTVWTWTKHTKETLNLTESQGGNNGP